MAPRTWSFYIEGKPELSAGFWGFTDEISITLDSGNPGGNEGEFEEHLRQSLIEWYDGASVEPLEQAKERFRKMDEMLGDGE